MGAWGYIAAAYGIAAAVLLGYHLLMSVRLRALGRRLAALRATAVPERTGTHERGARAGMPARERS